MFKWERRLKDLAQLLRQCESTYFDPELFRMNTNQFLQTSRTVTFIIQKTKSDIPEYEAWYQKNIIDAWKGDAVMKWAKDSRNTIEKEGDLEMYSSLYVTLIYSYYTEQDITIPCGRAELLGANVRKLKRLAAESLPDAISESAVVKTERTWVANTLPKWELLEAFKYIYSRLYVCCSDLAMHLAGALNEEIRRPADSEAENSNPRETIYFKLSAKNSFTMRHEKVPFDKRGAKNNPLESISESAVVPTNLEELVELYAKYAKAVFEKDGSHVPMCFFFESSLRPIGMLTTSFEDQAEKYIFWRLVADRIKYLKPDSLLWVCEGWLRNGQGFGTTSIRNLPIAGEFLEVVAMDKDGNLKRTTRMISRNVKTNKATLEEQSVEFEYPKSIPNYLAPAFEAFQLAHHRV